MPKIDSNHPSGQICTRVIFLDGKFEVYLGEMQFRGGGKAEDFKVKTDEGIGRFGFIRQHILIFSLLEGIKI